MVDCFFFHRAYFDAMQDLPIEKRGLLCDAILWYAFEGKILDDLPPAVRACLSLIRDIIDEEQGEQHGI